MNGVSSVSSPFRLGLLDMFSVPLLRSAHPSCISALVSLPREKPGATIEKHPIKRTTPVSLWAPLPRSDLRGVYSDLRKEAGKIKAVR